MLKVQASTRDTDVMFDWYEKKVITLYTVLCSVSPEMEP